MNLSSYKLVACDLDGTLLREDHTVSPENLLAIAEMDRLGIQFVPTTGRALAEMPCELLSSPHIRYYITSDGAAVFDKKTGEVVHSEYISEDMLRLIFSLTDKYTSYPVIHSGLCSYYNVERHTEENIKSSRLDAYTLKIVEDKNKPLFPFKESLLTMGKAEMGCIYFGRDEDLNFCKERLTESGKLSVAQTGKANFEVYSAKAGKGAALTALAKILAIPTESTVAIGDSKNDASLVGSAGLSLAMANASDDLKAIADEVICHYNEHCVKYVLEKFIKR